MHGHTGAEVQKHRGTGARSSGLLVTLYAVAVFFGCAGPEPRVDEGTISVPGAELYYRAVGQGDPVVIVHGGPGLDHRYLLPGMEVLARRQRLIFYDQRALGASSGNLDSATISWDSFVEDIDRVREFFDYDRITVLGHSWGGLLALEYAARFPDHARSVVLVNTVEPGKRYLGQARARQQRRQTAADSTAFAQLLASDAFRARDPDALREMYRLSYRRQFADSAMADRLNLDMTQRTFRNGSDVATLVMGPLGDFDLWRRLRDVQAPTLLIHGTADVLPVDVVWQMAEDLPDARVILLEGAGHFPYIEAPIRMRDAVEAFLEHLND